MAHDEAFAGTRADLIDPSKDDPRQRLLNLISKKLDGGSDQEVAELLGRIEGHGSASEQRPGVSAIDQLRHFLRGKGFSEDDIRTTCDLSGLGPERSAMRGGAFGGGAGGALHEERGQFNRATGNPASRDRAMTYEEESGCVPYAGDRRRGIGGRDSFEELYGRQDRLAEIAAASRPRRRASDRQMGMDARAVESFNARFPNAARIKPAY
jgi:hypothetical protein